MIISPNKASTLNIIFYSYTDADLAFHAVKKKPKWEGHVAMTSAVC